MRDPEPASLEMLDRLVSFDTTSEKTNLPLIDFVRAYLGDFGIEPVLSWDQTGTKANLFATIGPSNRPGIILSAHTDVVPVSGQQWSSDPFVLTRRGDRLYGRGTTDMKGFLASILALVPALLERNLGIPIHLALSYDEEVGCLGVRRLLADLAARDLRPIGCIVGEPTGMSVVRAHKGKRAHHVRVRGLEAHTGVPHLGANAIEAAAEMITFLKNIGRRLRDEGPFDPDFEAPAYTTIQTGLIRGGTAINIVAGSCEFDLDIRYLPGHDPASLVEEAQRFSEKHILPEMLAVAPEAGFTWDDAPGIAAFDNSEPSGGIVDLARELTGANRTYKVGFGTEAGHFQDAGIPTVVCGPGAIAQAHKPDEFIALEQLASCDAFLRRLIDRLPSGASPGL